MLVSSRTTSPTDIDNAIRVRVRVRVRVRRTESPTDIHNADNASLKKHDPFDNAFGDPVDTSCAVCEVSYLGPHV